MINKATFLGRISNIEEIVQTKNFQHISFNIATSSFNPNLKKEITTYIPCRAWNKIAENISENFSKGDLVFVEANFVNAKLENEDTKTGFKYLREFNVQKIKRIQKYTKSFDKKNSENELIEQEIDWELEF